MSTLDRYILKTFVKNLALVLLVLVSLYGLIEFLETVDDFIEHHAGIKYYLIYPLVHLPVILNNTLPMGMLLATFATIGGFSRSNQLTAMFCGGLSLGRISRPLFLSGTLLAFIVILANLWLVPWASRESNYIKRTEIKGKSSKEVSSKDIYIRDGSRIVSVNHAFPSKGVILGVTIIEFDDNFMPIKRTQAEQANHIKDGQWQFINVIIWEFIPETRAVASYHQKKELLLDIKRQPSEMLQLLDRPEDLSVNKLIQLTEKLRNEGYDPKAYEVETHIRFAKAAIPIIMVLIGIPFSLQRGRNTSFSLGIIISLAIFVVYFILYAVFSVFGSIAVLPPLIAAWAANILMALIGSWFFLKA